MSQLTNKILWILSIGFIVLAVNACSGEEVSSNQESEVIFSEEKRSSESIINNYEVIVDEAVPEEIVNMLIRHFDAMSRSDVEVFKTTLFPEDGSDFNSEPYAMGTFMYYDNTDVYLKEITICDLSLEPIEMFDETKLNHIVELIVWNPNEQQDEIFFAQISKQAGEWGISRYIQKQI